MPWHSLTDFPLAADDVAEFELVRPRLSSTTPLISNIRHKGNNLLEIMLVLGEAHSAVALFIGPGPIIRSFAQFSYTESQG